ncbi:MAG: hypothetical protein JW994_07410, partial [Candidatus Omnitrophica bacterium]|nr:hypothetical protein [Candidatus Omnitrophota bacterium]
KEKILRPLIERQLRAIRVILSREVGKTENNNNGGLGLIHKFLGMGIKHKNAEKMYADLIDDINNICDWRGITHITDTSIPEDLRLNKEKTDKLYNPNNWTKIGKNIDGDITVDNIRNRKCLKFRISLRGATEEYGAAAIKIRVKDIFGVDNIDMDKKEWVFKIKLPEEFAKNMVEVSPNGVEATLFDVKGHEQRGYWIDIVSYEWENPESNLWINYNEKPENNAEQWVTVRVRGRIPREKLEKPFDPHHVKELGIRLAIGARSRAKIEGNVYVTDFEIQDAPKYKDGKDAPVIEEKKEKVEYRRDKDNTWYGIIAAITGGILTLIFIITGLWKFIKNIGKKRTAVHAIAPTTPRERTGAPAAVSRPTPEKRIEATEGSAEDYKRIHKLFVDLEKPGMQNALLRDMGEYVRTIEDIANELNEATSLPKAKTWRYAIIRFCFVFALLIQLLSLIPNFPFDIIGFETYSFVQFNSLAGSGFHMWWTIGYLFLFYLLVGGLRDIANILDRFNVKRNRIREAGLQLEATNELLDMLERLERGLSPADDLALRQVVITVLRDVGVAPPYPKVGEPINEYISYQDIMEAVRYGKREAEIIREEARTVLSGNKKKMDFKLVAMDKRDYRLLGVASPLWRKLSLKTAPDSNRPKWGGYVLPQIYDETHLSVALDYLLEDKTRLDSAIDALERGNVIDTFDIEYLAILRDINENFDTVKTLYSADKETMTILVNITKNFPRYFAPLLSSIVSLQNEGINTTSIVRSLIPALMRTVSNNREFTERYNATEALLRDMAKHGIDTRTVTDRALPNILGITGQRNAEFIQVIEFGKSLLEKNIDPSKVLEVDIPRLIEEELDNGNFTRCLNSIKDIKVQIPGEASDLLINAVMPFIVNNSISEEVKMRARQAIVSLSDGDLYVEEASKYLIPSFVQSFRKTEDFNIALNGLKAFLANLKVSQRQRTDKKRSFKINTKRLLRSNACGLIKRTRNNSRKFTLNLRKWSYIINSNMGNDPTASFPKAKNQLEEKSVSYVMKMRNPKMLPRPPTVLGIAVTHPFIEKIYARTSRNISIDVKIDGQAPVLLTNAAKLKRNEKEALENALFAIRQKFTAIFGEIPSTIPILITRNVRTASQQYPDRIAVQRSLLTGDNSEALKTALYLGIHRAYETVETKRGGSRFIKEITGIEPYRILDEGTKYIGTSLRKWERHSEETRNFEELLTGVRDARSAQIFEEVENHDREGMTASITSIRTWFAKPLLYFHFYILLSSILIYFLLPVIAPYIAQISPYLCLGHIELDISSDFANFLAKRIFWGGFLLLIAVQTFKQDSFIWGMLDKTRCTFVREDKDFAPIIPLLDPVDYDIENNIDLLCIIASFSNLPEEKQDELTECLGHSAQYTDMLSVTAFELKSFGSLYQDRKKEILQIMSRAEQTHQDLFLELSRSFQRLPRMEQEALMDFINCSPVTQRELDNFVNLPHKRRERIIKLLRTPENYRYVFLNGIAQNELVKAIIETVNDRDSIERIFRGLRLRRSANAVLTDNGYTDLGITEDNRIVTNFDILKRFKTVLPPDEFKNAFGEIINVTAPILAPERIIMGSQMDFAPGRIYEDCVVKNGYPTEKLHIVLSIREPESSPDRGVYEKLFDKYEKQELVRTGKELKHYIVNWHVRASNAPGVGVSGLFTKPGITNSSVREWVHRALVGGMVVPDIWEIYDPEDEPNKLQMWTLAIGYKRSKATIQYLEEEMGEDYDASRIAPTALAKRNEGLYDEANHWSVDLQSMQGRIGGQYDEYANGANDLTPEVRRQVIEATRAENYERIAEIITTPGGLKKSAKGIKATPGPMLIASMAIPVIGRAYNKITERSRKEKAVISAMFSAIYENKDAFIKSEFKRRNTPSVMQGKLTIALFGKNSYSPHDYRSFMFTKHIVPRDMISFILRFAVPLAWLLFVNPFLGMGFSAMVAHYVIIPYLLYFITFALSAKVLMPFLIRTGIGYRFIVRNSLYHLDGTTNCFILEQHIGATLEHLDPRTGRAVYVPSRRRRMINAVTGIKHSVTSKAARKMLGSLKMLKPLVYHPPDDTTEDKRVGMAAAESDLRVLNFSDPDTETLEDSLAKEAAEEEQLNQRRRWIMPNSIGAHMVASFGILIFLGTFDTAGLVSAIFGTKESIASTIFLISVSMVLGAIIWRGIGRAFVRRHYPIEYFECRIKQVGWIEWWRNQFYDSGFTASFPTIITYAVTWMYGLALLIKTFMPFIDESPLAFLFEHLGLIEPLRFYEHFVLMFIPHDLWGIPFSEVGVGLLLWCTALQILPPIASLFLNKPNDSEIMRLSMDKFAEDIRGGI